MLEETGSLLTKLMVTRGITLLLLLKVLTWLESRDNGRATSPTSQVLPLAPLQAQPLHTERSLPLPTMPESSDISQPRSLPPPGPPETPYTAAAVHTKPPLPLTTPPRTTGTTTSPSSPITPRPTPSPPHSAHQRPRPCHRSHPNHGSQALMPVTSSKPQLSTRS
jgi:hypothetical protein